MCSDLANNGVNERIYVANLGINTVSVIDTNTNTVIGNRFKSDSQPVDLLIIQ